MVSYAPTSVETQRDQHLYLEENLEPVACLDCLAEVRVRKHSEYQTSIQWSTDAVARCAEFARRAAEGRRDVAESCSRLRASIERAAAEGVIQVDAVNEPVELST